MMCICIRHLPIFFFCGCDLFACFFFFFNDTATTEIYTLSLHDALPIWALGNGTRPLSASYSVTPKLYRSERTSDRKSTRLNSSHMSISYAVFCLKKKKKKKNSNRIDMKIPTKTQQHDTSRLNTLRLKC